LLKLKAARNELYHSPNNEVAVASMNKYFDDMEKLLNDALNDQDIEVDIRKSLTEDVEKLKRVSFNKHKCFIILYEYLIYLYCKNAMNVHK
jgi:DNA-binding transcriptional regulator YbjK